MQEVWPRSEILKFIHQLCIPLWAFCECVRCILFANNAMSLGTHMRSVCYRKNIESSKVRTRMCCKVMISEHKDNYSQNVRTSILTHTLFTIDQTAGWFHMEMRGKAKSTVILSGDLLALGKQNVHSVALNCPAWSFIEFSGSTWHWRVVKWFLQNEHIYAVASWQN